MSELIQEYLRLRIKNLKWEIKRVEQLIHNANLDDFLKPLMKNDSRYNPCTNLKEKLFYLTQKKEKLNERLMGYQNAD